MCSKYLPFIDLISSFDVRVNLLLPDASAMREIPSYLKICSIASVLFYFVRKSFT